MARESFRLLCVLAIFCFVVYSGGFAGAAEEVVAEKGLLFHVSFNARTPKADFAKGRADSTNFTRTLQYLTAPGVVGIGLETEDNESCNYEMAGNFNPKEGTLSIWVRPENWRPADARPYVFFAAEIPDTYRLLLYKEPDTPNVVFEISTETPKKETHRVTYNAGMWRAKRWHKLDASWNSKELTLYVDGEVAGTEDEKTRPADGAYKFPDADPKGHISINPNNYFQGKFGSLAGDRTVADEIKVFGVVLGAEELVGAYTDVKTALSGSVYRNPVITIPFDETPVKLDGALDPSEWGGASKAPIQYLRRRAEYCAGHFADIMLKYDSENLYLGFRAKGEKNPITTQTERDSLLWRDAALEFIWRTSESSGDTFQFIINSAAVIFDMKNNDKKWNGVTKAAASVDGGGWSLEVALSFKDLGIEAPEPGAKWRGNFMHDWDQTAGGYAVWSWGPFENSKFHGTLIFGGKVPGIRLDSLGNLALGNVDAATSLSSMAGAASRSVEFALTAEKSVPETLKRQLQPGKSVTFAAQGKLGVDNQLSITVRDEKGNEEFVFDQIFSVKPPVQIAYRSWPHLKRLDVDLDLTNIDESAKKLIAEGKFKGTLSLVSKKGNKAVSSAPVAPKKNLSTWKLPFPEEFPEGMYAVKVTFPNPYGGTYEKERPFEVPSMEPFEVKSGVDHTVPDPWLPLVVEGKSVRIEDKEYTLGASPFPVKMVSFGKGVLSKPIQLELQTKKGKEEIKWDVPKLVEKFDDEITFEGKGLATKSGLKLRYTAECEFDGQWLVTITLDPASPLEITSMHLSYALARESGEYVLAQYLHPWKGDTVELDLFDCVDVAPKRMSTRGGFWLTGLHTGLYFFTTTNGNWVSGHGKPNVHIRKRAGAVDVTIDIIEKPVRLKKKASYVFSVAATPPKSVPRKNFLSGDHGYIFQAPADKWLNWVSLVPTEPERLKKRVWEQNRNGILFLYQYAAPLAITGDNPYEDYFGAMWTVGNDYVETDTASACPNSSFKDLICYQVENLARDFGIGPYFDMATIGWCDNKAHGDGYTDSFGREAKTMPILGYREESKRIYKITHKYNCRVWNHNHSYFFYPAQLFSDLWFPGEQYTSQIVGNDRFYTQGVPRTDYLVEMNPFIHGVRMIFLPEWGRAYSSIGDKDFEKWEKDDKYIWAAEQVYTMILPHDIDFIGAYMHRKPTEKVSEVFRKQRVTQSILDNRPRAVFTGYWENPKIIPTDREMMLSYYTFPGEKRVLAVLSNPLYEERTTKIRINQKALELEGPLTVRDEYRDEDLPGWEKGISVPRESFRLLSIRGAASSR